MGDASPVDETTRHKQPRSAPVPFMLLSNNLAGPASAPLNRAVATDQRAPAL